MKELEKILINNSEQSFSNLIIDTSILYRSLSKLYISDSEQFLGLSKTKENYMQRYGLETDEMYDNVTNYGKFLRTYK